MIGGLRQGTNIQDHLAGVTLHWTSSESYKESVRDRHVIKIAMIDQNLDQRRDSDRRKNGDHDQRKDGVHGPRKGHTNSGQSHRRGKVIDHQEKGQRDHTRRGNDQGQDLGKRKGTSISTRTKVQKGDPSLLVYRNAIRPIGILQPFSMETIMNE